PANGVPAAPNSRSRHSVAAAPASGSLANVLTEPDLSIRSTSHGALISPAAASTKTLPAYDPNPIGAIATPAGFLIFDLPASSFTLPPKVTEKTPPAWSDTTIAPWLSCRKYGATRPGAFSALISNGTSTSRPAPDARAIELVKPGIAATIRAATPNPAARIEKLLFLFEKFIKRLVDNVFFVRIAVVQLGLATRHPLRQPDRRGLLGIRNPHRLRDQYPLPKQLVGHVNLNSLAQAVSLD